MSDRVCSSCKNRLPLDNFHLKSSSTGERRLICKSCVSKNHRRWYLENRLKVLGKINTYRAKNKEAIKERRKKWQEKDSYKISRTKSAKRMRIKYRQKYLAWALLSQAVLTKKVAKSDICAMCLNGNTRIEAHHEDYSRPLDVVWLCVACHKDIHKKGATQ